MGWGNLKPGFSNLVGNSYFIATLKTALLRATHHKKHYFGLSRTAIFMV